MSALYTALERFCYKHPRFGIPNLMLFIIIGNALVYVVDYVSQFTFSGLLSFVPAYLFRGQIWRLVTFVLVPESSGNPLLFAITLSFYYFIGSALERQWGTARFNVFYLFGVCSSIVVGLIIGALNGGLLSCFASTATMYYVNMSLFFAFATLYPDAQVLLWFILPIKIKWLAYLDGIFFVLSILRCFAAGEVIYALLPIVAILNYLVVFGADLVRAVRRVGARTKHRTSAQTVNFKQAVRQGQKQKGYLHKCCVCGRTDTEYPDLEFRYCSRCAGYRCYCMDHINNHVHITEE